MRYRSTNMAIHKVREQLPSKVSTDALRMELERLHRSRTVAHRHDVSVVHSSSGDHKIAWQTGFGHHQRVIADN
jgi:hypothetical protein